MSFDPMFFECLYYNYSFFFFFFYILFSIFFGKKKKSITFDEICESFFKILILGLLRDM